MDNSIVSISEHAFFTMATAALEAFKVDHTKINFSDSDAGQELEIKLETFGNLWGHTTISEKGSTIYYVSSADVSTSATREREHVLPRDEAYELKKDFVDYFFPELDFLGDYHSHPYDGENDVKTELELERNKLYQFSPGDFEAVRLEQNNKKDYRVGLVITVFERDDEIMVQRKDQWMDDTSCIRFQYDNVTIWIKAYVWVSKDGQKRRRTDKKVSLICPAVGFALRNLREAGIA